MAHISSNGNRLTWIKPGTSVVPFNGGMIDVVIRRVGVDTYLVEWNGTDEEVVDRASIRYGYSAIDPSKSDGTYGSSSKYPVKWTAPVATKSTVAIDRRKRTA